ncbi:hypothetical protein EOE67_15970 [Rheinheimera riviphila]|uniref:DUF2753 family protein n=1 Tax=Rheinheimera riviphila TaxID=1834037 RepID=A0A437QII3_9GAMM|nr:hypothetical protein [Rheinheimera riviphila]RVU34362.1 hypothetical protein EOE67_15970 [Rheinheimera riviphila]
MNTIPIKVKTPLVPADDDNGSAMSSDFFADDRSAVTTLFGHWQQLTRQANLALLQQQLPAARVGYQQALQAAIQLQAQPPLQDPHLAAFVISLHNLADLAMLEEKPAEARSLLGRAYRELWELCSAISTAMRAPAVLQIILPHLQLCRRELALFCHHFGPDAVSTKLLQLPWPEASH